MSVSSESRAAAAASTVLPDFLSSLVVFLVALPLCIGIAVACGVPAERGIITGIIGGILVGTAAGSPLLVSGPAASLIVPVYELVQTHGIVALGPVVMLAGIWQVLAGLFSLGQWFRAVAPAVISGMLIGIGILITASQLHVAIDADPKSTFVENVTALVTGMAERMASGDLEHLAPIGIGIATVVLIVGWNRARSGHLKLVPGHLVALLVVTAATALFHLPVRFLDVSPNFFAGLAPVAVPDLKILLSPSVFGLSLVFAFVASAATLLTAAAIDQRQTHARTNYNKEMMAQGTGNLITGALGGLPMTGVIVRSSVNVDAGARTRLSAILHGGWLLLFVAVAPQLLELVPRASLGAILVYTGYKLVDVNTLRELYHRDRAELAICLTTLGGVIFIGLFQGILLGFAAALARLSYTFSRLRVRSVEGPGDGTHHLHIAGSATFLRLPVLAEAIESVPANRELHVHVEELEYIDHACLELLSHARKSRAQEGRPGMVVEWNELAERHDPTYASSKSFAQSTRTARSLLGVLWRDWKRSHAPGAEPPPADEVTLPDDWLDASRVSVGLGAASLDEVIEEAARLLAPATGLSVETVASALRAPREGSYVTLGEGVGLPHAALSALDRPQAALVTTTAPIDVEGDALDVFFVLLAPAGDPRLHLVALAHVGRLCHDKDALASLRAASSPEVAAGIIRRSEGHAKPLRSVGPPAPDEVLVVVDIDGGAQAEQALIEIVREVLAEQATITSSSKTSLEPVREALRIPEAHRLLLFSMDGQDVTMLRRLLAESTSLLPSCTARLHLLQSAALPALS